MPLDFGASAAAVRIVAAAYPLVRRGKEALEARREIAEILPAAVASMLCEHAPETPSVRAAADAIMTQLGQLSVSDQQPGPVGRGVGWITGKLRLPRRRIPSVVQYGDASFDELMSAWMTRALEALDMPSLLERIDCPDGVPDATELARRFPEDFFLKLTGERRTRTAWRTALIDNLRTDAKRRRFVEQRRQEILSARTGTLATAATFVAANAAGADMSTSLVAAGVGGIVAGGTAFAGARHLQRTGDRFKQVVRHAVASWLDRLAAAVAAPPDAGAPSSTVERIERAWRADEHAMVPQELLDELEGHLLRGARDAGEDALAAALFVLRGALARATHEHDAVEEAVDALNEVARTSAT